MKKSSALGRLFAALAVSSIIVGCASPVRTEPKVFAGQQQIYRQGSAATISTKKYVVIVTPSTTVREAKDRLSFIVSVANTSDQPIDVSTTNFFARVDGRPLKIFTYDEIAQQIKTQQAVAAFAVALGGAMQAAAAQQQASYKSTYGSYNSATSGTVNTWGNRSNTVSNFRTNTVGTYSGWTYDPAAGLAAANAVNAQTSANLSNLQTQGQAALAAASSAILQRTTVFPNSSYGGRLILAEFSVPDQGSTVELTANIEGEAHTFSFSQLNTKR